MVVLAAEDARASSPRGRCGCSGPVGARGALPREPDGGETEPVTKAAESAYLQAEITDPQEEIDPVR